MLKRIKNEMSFFDDFSVEPMVPKMIDTFSSTRKALARMLLLRKIVCQYPFYHLLGYEVSSSQIPIKPTENQTPTRIPDA